MEIVTPKEYYPQTPISTSAKEWGRIARDAASKAIQCNSPGNHQWVKSHQEIARHAARMELLLLREERYYLEAKEK